MKPSPGPVPAKRASTQLGPRYPASGDKGVSRDVLPPPLTLLTPTQCKVLNGVYCGQLNKQIAFDLGIAEATVKAHMTALMRKLKVRNRTQLAIAAQTLGWNGRLLAH